MLTSPRVSAGEDCFPVRLLESLDTQPINGLTLIVSCRPERIPTTYAKCAHFQLLPFTKQETASFLRTRLPKSTDAEVNVAQARSGGNPRVLDYILKTGRGLLGASEIGKEIELDELIQKRLTDALATALRRGYDQKDIDSFLAGLAVLPPPVPPDEYAGAHGISLEAIESFASDLSPLLERTNQGLLFRDEPTETVVRERYASSLDALRGVASHLQTRQDVSAYAARALPGLLHQLGDSDQLFALAFDERIPSAITSTIGKRNVRYARLNAATFHAAQKKDFSSLVPLLLELSTVAAVDQRGSSYILDYPDLVVAAQDVDARRRLFDTRTAWPGTRHARLAIANTLSGESEESFRHAYAADEWIAHHMRTRRRDYPSEVGPERDDIAAIPLVLLSEGRGEKAARYFHPWRDSYVYEVCELVFAYANLAESTAGTPPQRLDFFISALSRIGTLAAALTFQELPKAKRQDLVGKLARYCKPATKLELRAAYDQVRTFDLADGLRKSAAIALTLGLSREAMAISLRAPHRRPRLWAYRGGVYDSKVFSFLFRVALRAVVTKKPVHDSELLPEDLARICSRIGRQVTGKEFRDKAEAAIGRYMKRKREPDKQSAPSQELRSEDLQGAERFLAHRLEALVLLTRTLAAVLAANSRNVDGAFGDLVEAWQAWAKIRDPYGNLESDHFFWRLGFDSAFFVFWCRSDLKLRSVTRFLRVVHEHGIDASSLVRIVSILAQRSVLKTLAGEQAMKARALIERENEVNLRASLFGSLARAMLPASIDEAATYFRVGLEQMDAIGSGDYDFTNELLLFASKMVGDELDEHGFHTLTNICELNMGDEPEKFFWGAFGRGMSKAAGLRGLAKLSRWDDRSKVAFKNTLLPYLTGLLEHRKIDAPDALALNRLANPVEYYFAGMKEFADALRGRAGSDQLVTAELIIQFQDDHPYWAMDDTVQTLGTLAREAFGSASDACADLAAARIRYARVRDTRNESNSYRDDTHQRIQKEAVKRDRLNREALRRIAAAANPIDERSLVQAIDEFNALGTVHDLKGAFFADLREKVPYDGRATYVRNIATLENLFFYLKLTELEDARDAWKGSSAALADVYEELACPLIRAHAEDLVVHGSLSGSQIAGVSKVTGVAITELTIELIKVFAQPDSMVSGSVWLGLATLICSKAEHGQGKLAIERLLSSDAARLADSVADGGWATGLYPPNEFTEIASGMVWRVLGSPYAIDRWRATHCLRSFAKFGRWKVIDNVVEKMDRVDAGPFQASELPFYYMHARLWLLIALARIGLDYPAEIARYRDALLSFVLEENEPHVLMRHFACRALLACMDAGKLKVAAKTAARVREANRSSHRPLNNRLRNNGGFYSGRPKSAPELDFLFYLDYEFHKLDVDGLARVFGQPCWKVADMISEIVHRIGPTVQSMHESGGVGRATAVRFTR